MDSKFLDQVRDTGSGTSYLPIMQNGAWRELTADEFYKQKPKGEFDLYFSVLTLTEQGVKKIHSQICGCGPTWIMCLLST